LQCVAHHTLREGLSLVQLIEGVSPGQLIEGVSLVQLTGAGTSPAAGGRGPSQAELEQDYMGYPREVSSKGGGIVATDNWMCSGIGRDVLQVGGV